MQGKRQGSGDGDRGCQRSRADTDTTQQLWPVNLEAPPGYGGISTKVEDCGKKFQRRLYNQTGLNGPG